MANELKYALLIDADNISPRYIRFILDELAQAGAVTYKRIYGDWTNTQNRTWKEHLLENSILPVQQYSNVTGKNATDSALIIDAMDILYSNKVDGFCIVSSDSDFTRLAARLRESGMTVLGMGERKTPKSFVSACSLFRYLDLLFEAEQKTHESQQAKKKQKPPARDAEGGAPSLDTILEAIRAIISENSDDDGWMYVSVLGGILQKRYSDFDVRNYGYKKLTVFLESFALFEMKYERREGNSMTTPLIKLK